MKKIIMILVLLSLVLISGCSESQEQSITEKTNKECSVIENNITSCITKTITCYYYDDKQYNGCLDKIEKWKGK